MPFSIGKHYRDEVLCDVVEMDACHVLLGRPWQYDIHYVFQWNNKKIVLVPAPIRDHAVPARTVVPNPVFYTVPNGEFLEALNDVRHVFPLIA